MSTDMSMRPLSTPPDLQAANQALAEAATRAGHAPSIHYTQPWRWRLTGDRLDLHVDRGQRTSSEADTRLTTLSCGVALHHARVGLAAQGWRPDVARMPDPADPDHLARVRVIAPVVDEEPYPLGDARPVPVSEPGGYGEIRAIAAAAAVEGGWLQVLRPDQVRHLASTADHTQRSEPSESAWRAASAPPRRHRAALFAVLCGLADEPPDWLRAGEAFSASWLTATELGVPILPLSATVEVAETRAAMRQVVSDLAFPYLVLRFG